MLEEYYWLFGVALVLGGSAVSNLGLNLQKLTHVKAQGRKAAGEAGEPGSEAGAAAGAAPEPSPRSEPTETPAGTDDDDAEGLRLVSAPATPSGDAPHADEEFELSDAVERGAAGAAAAAAAAGDDAGGDSYFKEPLWLLGLGLVILGSVADFVALGFAAQTVVAPLGSFTLVTNVWFAQTFSGEKLSRRDIWATLTIILGCVLSVAFANHADKGYSFDELFSFYASPRFLAYALVISGLVGVLYTASQRVERRRQLMTMNNSPAVVEFRRLGRAQRFYFGALSGIVGAQSVLFAKSFAELAREGIGSLWLRYESYLIIGGMCSCIFGQIKWMNEGLKRYDALYMVPCFQSFWIVFSVIGGLVVYREASAMTGSQAFLFTVGIGVTVFGVYLLSQRASSGAVPGAAKELYMQVVDQSPERVAKQGFAEAEAADAAAAAACAPLSPSSPLATGVGLRSCSLGDVGAGVRSPQRSPNARPLPTVADEADRRRRRSRSDSLSTWLPNLAGQVADIRDDAAA